MRATSEWRGVSVVYSGLICAFLFLACENQQRPVSKAVDDQSGANWSSDDTRDTSDRSADSIGSPNGEVCDGWDNDQDGLTDEGTDGQPCQPDFDSDADPSDRVFRCIRGELLCTECQPLTERRADCGCNIARMDVCSDLGRWVHGVCDGCEQPLQVCECNPGEQKIARCDQCVGDDCGATCVGAMYRCTDDCQWEQVSECDIQPKECDRDQFLEEPCGNCGTRHVTCDGCFWMFGTCEEQGACRPGESRTIPCLTGSDACTEGYVATIECNDQCEWFQAKKCRGCALGTTVIRQEDCTPAPGGDECGTVSVGYACEPSKTYSLCDDSIELPVGKIASSGEYLSECEGVPCGAVPGDGDGDANPGDGEDGTGDGTGEGVGVDECLPGSTQVVPCTNAAGLCGTALVECAEGGTWSVNGVDCVVDPDACVPGERQVFEMSCGSDACGLVYTLVKVCIAKEGECVWKTDYSDKREACPECAEGETRTVDCTTPDGKCGLMDSVCDAQCEWEQRPCEPLPDACEPGAERVTQKSCGEDTCGRTYQIVEKCDGCDWRVVSDNRDEACPDCQTGDTTVIQDDAHLCKPGFPECGYRALICNGQCEWEEQPCPPCG